MTTPTRSWLFIGIIESAGLPLISQVTLPAGGRFTFRQLSPLPQASAEREPRPFSPADSARVADLVLQMVAKEYGLPPEALLSASQEPRRVEPRHAAMYLAKEMTGASYPQMGAWFRRHHTTVMSAVCKVRALRAVSRELDARLTRLRDEIERLSIVEAV